MSVYSSFSAGVPRLLLSWCEDRKGMAQDGHPMYVGGGQKLCPGGMEPEGSLWKPSIFAAHMWRKLDRNLPTFDNNTLKTISETLLITAVFYFL